VRLYFRVNYIESAIELLRTYGLKPDSREDETGGYFEIAIPERWDLLRKQRFVLGLERFDSRLLHYGSLRSQAPPGFFPTY
jgi:hypothetical protein